jgi:hypothetical protein
MDARNFVRQSGFSVQTEDPARTARRQEIIRRQLSSPPPPPPPPCQRRNPLENEFAACPRPHPAPPVKVVPPCPVKVVPRPRPCPVKVVPRRRPCPVKVMPRPCAVKVRRVRVYRGTDDDVIRSQLKRCFGCKWMQRYKPNLTRDMWRIKREVKNGANARDVERRLVAHWKRMRGKKLEKLYLMKTVSVRGIPYHSRNAWRDAVSNYIMNYRRTHKRRSPTKKRMRLYKRRWLKRRREELRNAVAKRRRKARAGEKKIRARRKS